MASPLKAQPGELPALAAIGATFRWLEELITLVSGPLLTGGLAIALIDLLTDGKLLSSEPVLLYAWAVSQAVGVDGQLVGAAVKCGRAIRAGKWWVAAACIPLIGALGYVAYLASNVFATQQALGITTQDALGQLGMDSTSWIVARSLLAVVLVVLSGLLRYEPVKVAAETTEERDARMQREMAEARHKLEMRKLGLVGLAQAGRAAVMAAAKGDQADEQPPDNDGVITAQSEAEGTPNDASKAPTTTRRGGGRSAVPSDMMSAPQFRAYLADNGVPISDEKARAIVQSCAGFEKIGTAYCAKKGALMRAANRMLDAAQGQGDAEPIAG